MYATNSTAALKCATHDLPPDGDVINAQDAAAAEGARTRCVTSLAPLECATHDLPPDGGVINAQDVAAADGYIARCLTSLAPLVCATYAILLEGEGITNAKAATAAGTAHACHIPPIARDTRTSYYRPPKGKDDTATAIPAHGGFTFDNPGAVHFTRKTRTQAMGGMLGHPIYSKRNSNGTA